MSLRVEILERVQRKRSPQGCNDVMGEIVAEESVSIPRGRDLCHRLSYENGHLSAQEICGCCSNVGQEEQVNLQARSSSLVKLKCNYFGECAARVIPLLSQLEQ